MPTRIVLIGTDKPGLEAAQRHLDSHPEAEAVVLYPELNPLPEFICAAIERHLKRGMQFPERLRACGINREAKRVRMRDVVSGVESTLDYDTLILASGAAPGDLDVPGEHLGGVLRVGNDDDAKRLRPVDGVTVVVGRGLNMLQAVSALMGHDTGRVEVIIPPAAEVGEPLSPGLAAMVRHHLAQSGVTVHQDKTVTRIEAHDGGLRIHTGDSSIAARRLVNATASVPVSYLAQDSGIETSGDGGILVDGRLATNDPDIYACGGCASFVNPACRKPIPGTAIRVTERRQAEVLAAAIDGGDKRLTTPVRTSSVRLGDLAVASAGLTVEAARRCGFEPKSATVVQQDRAHFMPGVELMTLELVFDAPTRRVLGIQGLGKSADALLGRIGTVAAILPKKPVIEDIANLEVGYCPPFASAMDVVNAVANVADNILAGTNVGIGVDEFERRWAKRGMSDDYFLDCREIGNARPFIEAHPEHWHHIPQGELDQRINEVPRDRNIVLLCNTGARSYEAQVLLTHAGYTDVVNVDGGIAAVKQRGVKL